MIAIFSLFILFSCNALPQLFQNAEDVLTDTAITCEITKEAISDRKDVDIHIAITNPGK